MNTHTRIGIKTLEVKTGEMEVKRNKQRAQKSPLGAGWFITGSAAGGLDSLGSGAPALRALPAVPIRDAAGVVVPQHGSAAPGF